MPNNKINWGLCKMAYSIITETAGVANYGVPIMLPGAVNFSSAPRGDETEFEADNVIFSRASGNDGYDVTLEIANVPDEFLRDVMGETEDAKKVLIEKNNAEIKRVALLGQFEGDVHKKRFVLYSCLPKRSNFDGSTSRKKEPKTRIINFTADPLEDGTIKASTKSDTDATVYSEWFDEVYTETQAVEG